MFKHTEALDSCISFISMPIDTFHENPIETHPVLAAAVKALPTLAYVRALRPTGAHAVRPAGRALIDALKSGKKGIFRSPDHHPEIIARSLLWLLLTCVVSVWHLCVPLKKAI